MIDLQQAGQGREGYALLAAQLEALLADERDFVANAAQFSAFLFHELGDLNWAGFYLNKGEQLVLGPFQGKVACVRIPFGRGVCGAAASSRQTQRVDPAAIGGCGRLQLPVVGGQHGVDVGTGWRVICRLCGC